MEEKTECNKPSVLRIKPQKILNLLREYSNSLEANKQEYCHVLKNFIAEHKLLAILMAILISGILISGIFWLY